MRLCLLLVVLATTVAASLPSQSIAGFSTRLFTSDEVFRALAKAYPDRVKLKIAADGPSVFVDGQPFSWAEARLLPYAERLDWAQEAPHSFYEYSADQPDVSTWTDERLARAEERLADRVATNVKRDPAFFDALWGIHNRTTADAAQRKVRFLGMAVSVHYRLREPLERVQARLLELRQKDAGVDEFLKNLSRLEGYNWRVIAGTQSRSNHAYGTAIDIIPRSYGSKNPYWLWAPQESDGWYRRAWNARWQVPLSIVRAFEAEGFVWGGKWLLFDTIHFEYRPEILILNGLR